MALPNFTAEFDSGTNSYIARNTGTWANVTTWASWTTWSQLPAATMLFYTEPYDRGQVGYFNLRTDTDHVGNITYQVYTSTTGAFQGEETLTTVTANSSNIAAFYGQYYVVAANVASTGAIAQLKSMTITSTDASLDLKFTEVQTSSLTQTAQGARITLPRIVSAVTNMQITCYDGGNTTPLSTDTTHYYMETPIYRALIPYITSRDRSGPTFVLRDINYGTLATSETGHYIDARLTVLPEQIHDGKNLTTR